MHIGKYVYNALKKLMVGFKGMLTSVFIALAVIMIPLSFFLLTIESVSWHWSAYTALIGFISLIMATVRAYKEDKESKASRERLNQSIIDLISVIKDYLHGRKE